MLYTTYFAKLKNLPDDVVPISICAKPPKGYVGLQYKKLAPTYHILMEWKQTHNNDAYVEAYDDEVLSNFRPQKIFEELKSMAAEDKDVALVCFEKSSDFCHRHLVSQWFRDAGIPCEEFV